MQRQARQGTEHANLIYLTFVSRQCTHSSTHSSAVPAMCNLPRARDTHTAVLDERPTVTLWPWPDACVATVSLLCRWRRDSLRLSRDCFKLRFSHELPHDQKPPRRQTGLRLSAAAWWNGRRSRCDERRDPRTHLFNRRHCGARSRGAGDARARGSTQMDRPRRSPTIAVDWTGMKRAGFRDKLERC